MASALDGFTVLDLTTTPAGALATMLLGDHGARVIRLIEPEADAFRKGGFVIWDRGKECLRIDLGAINRGQLGSDATTRFVEFRPHLVWVRER